MKKQSEISSFWNKEFNDDDEDDDNDEDDEDDKDNDDGTFESLLLWFLFWKIIKLINFSCILFAMDVDFVDDLVDDFLDGGPIDDFVDDLVEIPVAASTVEEE